MTGHILKLDDVSYSYGDTVVLQEINLTLAPGEILTIIGPNGSGKTTLAKIALGLFKPTQGTRTVKDTLTVGYIPQNVVIEPLLPLTVKKFLSLHVNADDDNIITNIAHEIGIEHLLKNDLHQLSGGQLQRVALGFCLIGQPEMIILDEPTQGLDVTGQIEFYRLIEEIRDLRQTSILMVSHDLYMVMKATDRVLCLNKHICCAGTPDDISRHPEYNALFDHEVIKTMSIYSHHHDHQHNIN